MERGGAAPVSGPPVLGQLRRAVLIPWDSGGRHGQVVPSDSDARPETSFQRRHDSRRVHRAHGGSPRVASAAADGQH